MAPSIESRVQVSVVVKVDRGKGFMDWEKIRLFLGGAAFGAFVLVGVGFGWGGWVFESKAKDMARQAVLDRLVPICVAQFMDDPGRKRKRAKLEDFDYAEKTDYIQDQGWATIPGKEDPDPAVARRCLREIRFARL